MDEPLADIPEQDDEQDFEEDEKEWEEAGRMDLVEKEGGGDEEAGGSPQASGLDYGALTQPVAPASAAAPASRVASRVASTRSLSLGGARTGPQSAMGAGAEEATTPQPAGVSQHSGQRSHGKSGRAKKEASPAGTPAGSQRGGVEERAEPDL